MTRILTAIALCAAITGTHATSQPDDHAPIGVMRDHVHKQGEIMLSYRFAFMNMEDNRRGTSNVSTEQVLADYMVSPTEMTMTMHMFGIMYGVSDSITTAIMTGLVDKEMDHTRRNGTMFTADSDSLADTRISMMYEFYNTDDHRMQLNMGLSLPTGSITQRNPAGQILPYPMQTGSGTYDLLPGISYSGKKEKYSWGTQANATITTGRNNRGYTRGNSFQLTGWLARRLNNAVSISIRLDGQRWQDIKGRDRQLQGPAFPVPTADPSIEAGTRIDALAGINLITTTGKLKGNRLAAEIGLPIYQDINGPRLETDYRLIIGWQFAF